jgi:hypothetical protein
MRNFTRSTGNKEFDFYTRANAQVVQVVTVLKSRTNVTGGVRPGIKYYFESNPVVESNTTIGIEGFQQVGRIVGPTISDNYPYPFGAFTVQSFGLDRFLTVTFCDSDGKILFNRVPLTELVAPLRKVKPYTGQICLFKSYFQLTNAPIITTADPIVVNLAFFLRK